MLIPFKLIPNLKNKIKGVLHVGAHELEELPQYLSKGIENIIWIEANPQKYEFLESILKNYKYMFLGKFAAGNTRSKKFLNIANNGQSSSLLPFGTHKNTYPEIFYTSKEEVQVIPIDDWLDKNVENSDLYNFINIDIQGFELEALKGMPKHLKKVEYIYLEVNFREVYQNCSQLKDIDKFLLNYNFERVGMYRTIKGWGDAIYSKKSISFLKIYYLLLIPLIRIINFPLKVIKKLLKISKSFLDI